MENMGIQFMSYSAFTEATRQVQKASDELQRSFEQQRQRAQAQKKVTKAVSRAQGAAKGK